MTEPDVLLGDEQVPPVFATASTQVGARFGVLSKGRNINVALPFITQNTGTAG
jgi:hypothetical protein